MLLNDCCEQPVAHGDGSDGTLDALTLSSSSLDESRASVDQILQATFPRMSELKREQFLDSLLSRVHAMRLAASSEFDELDDIETAERDGSCQLCGARQRITIHHLIPKLVLKRIRNHKKDRVDVRKYLVDVCRPCHDELHRLWGHGELAKEYQTVDMILEAPDIQPYLQWKRKRERTLE